MSRSKAKHRQAAPAQADPTRGIITPERRQHDDLAPVDTLVDKELRRTLKVTTQTPLDRYFQRGILDGSLGIPAEDRATGRRRFDAGERLRKTWHRAGIAQRVTGSYAEPSGGGRDWTDLTVSAATARAEYREAMQAVGIILSPVAVAVCCMDETAGAWSKRARGDDRQGVTLLLAALDALARHWRY